MSAALARGDRALRDYQELLERGTPEDVWTDLVKRGATVRWDILKHRALAAHKVTADASAISVSTGTPAEAVSAEELHTTHSRGHRLAA